LLTLRPLGPLRSLSSLRPRWPRLPRRTANRTTRWASRAAWTAEVCALFSTSALSLPEFHIAARLWFPTQFNTGDERLRS
jgi:hypothetical protein